MQQENKNKLIIVEIDVDDSVRGGIQIKGNSYNAAVLLFFDTPARESIKVWMTTGEATEALREIQSLALPSIPPTGFKGI